MSQELMPCLDCGMWCTPGEYHPFAACLMFRACNDSGMVRANLPNVRPTAQAVAVDDAMVERGCRAVCEVHGVKWEALHQHERETGRKSMRAALQAAMGGVDEP